MLKLQHTPLCLAVAAVVAAMGQPVLAQGGGEKIIEEVITIGTRSSAPRSATDSPVPVDVFSGEDFNALGNSVDVTDNLRALVPSYTATPLSGDGSAFVRPTSLRGTAPDQTLVLVNGKRRHRSALIHAFAPAAGNGSQAPDVGMIPGIGVKRVEVLRDGAAAQYGSDAIAGVINFEMKDDSEGGEVQVQYGQFFEDSDETSMKIAGNAGFALGDSGFLNVTIEHVDNDQLIRSIQRPDAQALIDAGNVGVGEDSPFNDAPNAQTWGRPENKSTRFFVNTGFDISDDSRIYAFGSYAEADGRYRFFYRNPSHSSIATLVDDFGYTGSLLETGYTGFLDGAQKDYAIAVGWKGQTGSEFGYDLSVNYGKNELDYFLNNGLNADLGLGADGEPLQRNFDVGAFEQSEINVNADFTKQLSDSWFLAFGAEWREETWESISGEPNSYFGSGTTGSGFTSPAPQDAGEFDRDNYSVYADVEYDVTEAVLLQAAARYEDYADFGSTTIGKLAGRWSVTDNFTLRAAGSTGFHAPTPGQANLRTTNTTFDGMTGLQVEELQVAPTDPLAIANGGAALTEEKSVNYSVGFTADFGESTTLTVDAYQIEVSDRIYRTGDIAVVSPDVSSISFYTNAMDLEHKGLDVVLTSGWDWGDSVNTDITFAYNHNQVEVTDQQAVNTPTGPVIPVSDANVEDIENNFPENRFVLTANTYFGSNFNLLLRANFYGDHYDERGRIGADVEPSAKIGEIMYIDLELGWDVSDNVRIVAGGSNIFDEYVDEVGPPNANRLSVGLPYPRRSAANYEGGSWYLRAAYRW